MKSILDPTFKYTDSASTDIRKLFDKVRKEQAAQKPAPVDGQQPAIKKLWRLK